MTQDEIKQKRVFKVLYTGDCFDPNGRISRESLGLDLVDNVPYIQTGFLEDQKPDPKDPTYWDRLYCLEIMPHHVAEANGLVVCRPWVKTSAFSCGAESLVVIGRAGAGYDKIDLEACTASDVAVFNSPDTLVHTTASAALLLILALAKRLPEHERLARSGCWDRQRQIIGDDLPGQTLGIVGFGRSGAELARLVAPFKMRVLAYSPHADRPRAEALQVTLVPTLDDLLRESDFISLHCRLEERTRGLIGERELRLMKPTAYFINVARGEIVQQDALVRCLRERWIAGAALDVFEEEPLPADDPLLGLDNVILTPHYLPSSRQSGRATAVSIAEGIIRVANGQIPDHVLNPAVLERPGFRAKLYRFAQ